MKSLLSIYGDCLEGIGIRAPRKAVRDTSLNVRVGDLVHCRRHSDTLDSYIKVVLSYNPETEEFTVGTRYADATKDFSFVPEEIHGVITEIFDGDGRCVYERSDDEKS